MPRAIWSGSLLFGLVNVPVRMFSAIDEKDLHFHLLHRKDDSRIGYEKVCKKEGKPVPTTRSGRRTRSRRGSTSISRRTTSRLPSRRAIERSTSDFVPSRRSTRSTSTAPITWLRRGWREGLRPSHARMDEAGLAAIGTYVMRDKQHLGCLRVRDGVLLL